MVCTSQAYLGLLLIAQAPFKRQHLKQILNKDDEQVRDALTRLGGLVSTDGQDRCSLFHLKLQDYLRRDIFPKDEEENLHEIMIRWCESIDMSGIWKDEKLNVLKQEQYEYIKLYYIVHLYQAKEWQQLFTVLNDKSYGQAKMQCDPMRRSYILDLDIGRKAASWEGWAVDEGITHLPSLWRYSLLQCSLASRANAYSKDAFKALLLLKRDREAVELAELLTKPDYKAEILLLLAKHFFEEEPKREQESLQLLRRCYEVAKSIEKEDQRATILCDISRVFLQTQQLEQAKAVLIEAAAEAQNIKDTVAKATVLKRLSITLVWAGQWDQARRIVQTIESQWLKVGALGYLGSALLEKEQWRQTEAVWTNAETGAEMMEEGEGKSDAFYELAVCYIEADQWQRAETLIYKMRECRQRNYALLELSFALAKDRQWERSIKFARTIDDDEIRADALSQIGTLLAKAQNQDMAQNILEEVTASMKLIKEEDKSSLFSYIQGKVLIRTQQWEEAMMLIGTIDESHQQMQLLSELGEALIQFQWWNVLEDVLQIID